MASRATIKVEPQHIPPHIKKLNIEVDFEFREEESANDIHMSIRPLSAFGGEWTKIADIIFNPLFFVFPYTMQFDKPAERGTYDIRVVFTINGVKIEGGERIGQFFVD